MRASCSNSCKNKLDENVARPKDQIADYEMWDTLSCSMAIQLAEPGPGFAPPCSLFHLTVAPATHSVGMCDRHIDSIDSTHVSLHEKNRYLAKMSVTNRF